ncbi:MAG: Stk1 family PASTA domain-containing Ser/Thr kinase [Lactobacillus sp.]|nr:Stk1 family PASTA domain-containing Ser/Thr kinase [Lactobacillus sp.]
MITKGYLLGERYRILETLGEGGMANVYLAEDIILKQKVAVKMLRLDLARDIHTVERFKREALATSELSHPNIVSVLDVNVETDGQPYMVMEYVSGPDLKTYIMTHNPIPLTETIEIMDQILSAMSLAHRRGVIHRDLKPQNILMDNRGKIKIADFGIAVALNQSSVTQTNSIIGSVHYMSPEQTRGGMATKQSDIYSLGVILYELLTGQVPFSGESAMAVALKHAQEKVPTIRKNHPEITQALENVVLKAMSKNPANRYATIDEMRRDLDTSLDPKRIGEAPFVEPSPNNEETMIIPALKKEDLAQEAVVNSKKPEQLSTSVKKHKYWWAFMGLAGLLIVALFVFASWNSKQMVTVPDLTNQTKAEARSRLKSVGLRMGEVSYKTSSKYSAGKVLSSLPSAGSKIARGKSVDIVIARAQMVTMPNVIGQNVNDAVETLEAMGFTVKRTYVVSTTISKNSIVDQSIMAGTRVNPKKTAVKLMISKGKPVDPNEFKMADLTGKKLSEARDYANEKGLNLKIKYETSESVDSGDIISQSLDAGSKVHRGDDLTIVVSKGSNADNTVTKEFSVSYDDSADNDDDQDTNSSKGNHIKIYIKDDNHSIDDVYRDTYIKKDTDFSIPFTLAKGSGYIRIEQDGQTILDEKVTK